MLERQVCAGQAAQHIGDGHGQHKVPPNMALECKQQDGSQVGRGVEQLGTGRCVQKIVAQQAHQQKYKEAAGAGPKKSVIKTDDCSNAAGHQGFTLAGKARCVLTTQFLLGQGVSQHHKQHQRQGLAQKVG